MAQELGLTKPGVAHPWFSQLRKTKVQNDVLTHRITVYILDDNKKQLVGGCRQANLAHLQICNYKGSYLEVTISLMLSLQIGHN